MFHREVREAIVGGAGLKQLRDVRMGELRECLLLGLEARGGGIGLDLGGEDLECDLSLHRCALLSQIDHAHPALAERAEDLKALDSWIHE